MWSIISWVVCILLVGVLMFCSISMLVSVADIKTNHINPTDMTTRVYVIWIAEVAVHGFMMFLLLIQFEIFTLILNLPVAGFHAYLYSNKKHVVENISIFQGTTLVDLRNRALVKLAFYLLSFFFYLYCFYASILEYTQLN
eukprot:TRINITY_DN11910_c0_g1_i1.p1 TRINITY_DN11910_c0_g1~~TRINITY_DN11910_c0_g1_i1.p1  ORF type:complete len:141 (-),score=8.59 TRINITY_DN11910_c0_g1_i1:37-459(-)